MKKRALIVGVNRYRTVTPLNGCVNDVTNLRIALKELAGFANDDMRLLVDERATKTAIEERLAWLTHGAEAGDLVVFHFSGHGSQVRDRGPADELSDHLDEIICPWDMDWDETFITDDYLSTHLRVREGVVIEAILDCCNSGDGSTEVSFDSGAVEVSPDRRARFLTPPPDIVSRHEGERLPRRRLLRSDRRGGLALWSACADTQTAADARIQGIFVGAFTFWLCHHLRDSGGAVPRSELLELVRASLRDEGFSQVPELSTTGGLAASPPFRI